MRSTLKFWCSAISMLRYLLTSTEQLNIDKILRLTAAKVPQSVTFYFTIINNWLIFCAFWRLLICHWLCSLSQVVLPARFHYLDFFVYNVKVVCTRMHCTLESSRTSNSLKIVKTKIGGPGVKIDVFKI